jgi:hypothetical protein
MLQGPYDFDFHLPFPCTAVVGKHQVGLAGHRAAPLVSIANKVGEGNSTCNTAFSPSYLPSDATRKSVHEPELFW